jgi:hypothetical protein
VPGSSTPEQLVRHPVDLVLDADEKLSDSG